MKATRFTEAIDLAVAEAMLADDRVLVIGEDVQMFHGPLFARFGPERVMNAPISESAFLGAGVGAAMAGLRPIVEIMLVDFIAVAFSAVLNEMSKVETFSGGRWQVPLVVRAACGGGYGDAGQHEQNLWGMFGAIPGLSVVVPSTPEDARGLMASAIAGAGPVIFLEHKLLSENWLEWMGRGGRENVEFDVPEAGTSAELSPTIEPVPIGEAITRRPGSDVSLISLGVGVHRALAAATKLEEQGVDAEVIDLRSVRPLDRSAIIASVQKTGRALVIDEDYLQYGLTGEVAAVLLEAGLKPAFRRLGVDETVPFARSLEDALIPNVTAIVAGASELMGG